jgi:hypothetical protein
MKIASIIAGVLAVLGVHGQSFPIIPINPSFEQGLAGWSVVTLKPGTPNEVFVVSTPTNWPGYGTNALILGVTKQQGVEQNNVPVVLGYDNHITVKVRGEHLGNTARAVMLRVMQHVPVGQPPYSGKIATTNFSVGPQQTKEVTLTWHATNGLPYAKIMVFSGCVTADFKEQELITLSSRKWSGK